MTPRRPIEEWATSIDAVVVAASLGGLNAIESVLGGIDPDFPAPFIVLQHRRVTPDLLTGILERKLRLPVAECRSGTALRGPGVFVVPPCGHIEISERRELSVTGTESATADQVLQAVATRFGARCIATILTGGGTDGARGITAVKRVGGRVLVQEPSSAMASDMPNAALATGNVDFVLPLAYMGSALITLALAPGAADMLRVATPSWARVA